MSSADFMRFRAHRNELPHPLLIIYKLYSKDKPTFLRESEKEYTWTIFVIKGGRLSYEIEGVKGEAGAGSILFCPPYSEFKRKVLSPVSLYYAKFLLDEDRFDMIEQTKDILKHTFRYNFIPSEQDRFSYNLRQLISLQHLDDNESENLKRHYTFDLWTMMYLEANRILRVDQMSGDPLMKKAKGLIEQHSFENIQMQDVADLLGLKPTQFTRRFQRIFGVSPSRYLSAIRMEKAKGLLMDTNQTIEEIAKKCGYENGFYFSRMFTKYTKMNPSQFRKIHIEHSP